MPLSVVALAKLSAVDRRWLAELGALYRPADAGVGPHFPLLTLPPEIDAAAAAAEVERVAGVTAPFPLMLRTAAPTLDEAADGWRVDLLPDDGEAQLIALRAALGGGGLFAPYLPLACADRDACEGLAAHLCQQDLEVAATVAALALVQWDADEARVLATCALQS